MIEVFCPVDGRPIYRTRFLWLARLVCRWFHSRVLGGLDYAPVGEGWSQEDLG